MVPNLDIFAFLRNFAVRQIRGCWFQIWQYCFQMPAQKYQNKAFLFLEFWNFYFCTKLCSKTNSTTVIWIMTTLFSNSSPKIRKLGIFGSKFKDFYFALYFAIRNIWGCWFQIWEWFFRILAQKYQNKAFFCPKCIFFLNFAWSFEY